MAKAETARQCCATSMSVAHTVMTTLPQACPAYREPIAFGTSLNGYVRSMTGFTFPASINSFSVSRSSLLCCAMNGASR
jgi:hypothetical protein